MAAGERMRQPRTHQAKSDLRDIAHGVAPVPSGGAGKAWKVPAR